MPEERSGEVTLNESEEEPRVPRVSGVAGGESSRAKDVVESGGFLGAFVVES